MVGDEVTPKPPKPKSCKVCKVMYAPQRMGQKVCGPVCASKFARDMSEKSRKVLEAAERHADKAKREAMKSHAELIKEAQAAFNAYIRARDHDKPCISCGRHHNGQWHAGHYLSTGARPELRFEPLNVHKQCQPCNTHLHGNLILYRGNLIERIGLDKVLWLEGPHDPLKKTSAELVELKKKYRALARELEKETA